MAAETYTARVPSPLGDITLMSDGEYITGLWFGGQAHFGAGLPDDARRQELPVFQQAKAWLNRYFSGENPGHKPPLAPRGTPFQQRVWQAVEAIPMGEVRSYSDLMAQVKGEGGNLSSPRAVGSAVARNPISLLIPCHRVVGKGGQLTGYAGGLERKRWLLRLEGAQLEALEQ